MNSANPNLPMLESVVAALGPLCQRFVFVGGCITGLLVTESGSPPVRATMNYLQVVQVLVRTPAVAAADGRVAVDTALHLAPIAAEPEDPQLAKLRALLDRRIGEAQLAELMLAVDAEVHSTTAR